MTVFERQLLEGEAHGRTLLGRRRRRWALESIHAMLRLAPKSYLSLSWGKQSIVLAHMLWRLAPATPMYFLASWETWAMHDFERVIEEFTARFPIDHRIVQTDRSGEESWADSRRAGNRDLQTMCPRADWDGWYWGLSKDESRARRITLSNHGPPKTGVNPAIFRYADGKYRCCPLSDWSRLDLAAYIEEHDLPLLSIYQTQGLTARTTARMTGVAADNGGVEALRRSNMTGFNRLCARYPEIRGKG